MAEVKTRKIKMLKPELQKIVSDYIIETNALPEDTQIKFESKDEYLEASWKDEQ